MNFRFLLLVTLLSTAALAQSNVAPTCGMESCPHGQANVFCRPIDRIEVKWGSGRSNGVRLKLHICTVNPGGPLSMEGGLNLYVGVRDNPMNGRVDIDVEDCSVNIAIDQLERRTFSTGVIQFDSIYSDAFALKSEMRLWRMGDPDQWYIIESRMDPRYDRVFRTSVQGSGQVTIECKIYADSRDPGSRRARKVLAPNPN